MAGRPLAIHEQNAIPGFTNRALAKLAKLAMSGFPLVGYRVTGNPVRTDIAELPAPAQRLAGRSGPLRLLIVGGSLGAQVFNETLPGALSLMASERRPQVWHQTGRNKSAGVENAYRQAGVQASVHTLADFIEDMPAAYAWADLVLCRAGALTVAEVAAAGVAAVFVPFPHAVDDHQTANARYLTEQGAGVLLPQNELTPEHLAALLAGFERSELLRLAEAARGQSKIDATESVVNELLSIAR